MLIIIVFGTFVLICCVFLFIKYSKIQLKEFKEPPGNFLFGHVFLTTSLITVLNELEELLTKYGKTLQLRIGPKLYPLEIGILTADYTFMKFILSNNNILRKSKNYTFLKPWLGRGLLLSTGDYWRKHRKLLTPAFHFGVLKQFVEIFERVGDVLVEKMKTYDGEDSIDLHPLVTLCTLDIICETAMGTKMDTQNNKHSSYVESVQEMCKIVLNRCISPIKLFDTTYWLTQDFYVLRKHLKYLHTFTANVINSKRNSTSDNENRKKAFLDILLQLAEENNLSDREIREEVDTFMFEGHDTTSSAICFTLYCIAHHPEVQDQILQEQKSLLNNEKNSIMTYGLLLEMTYLELVIKEALRIYPSVPIIGRLTEEDIYFDDRLIRNGTNLVLDIYHLHRDPEYFPDPDKFIPERFKNFDPASYAYIPFSAGSRNCIGQKFAMLELKSIISKLVREFELRPANPCHEPILCVEAVLKSANGIRVGLRKRK